MKRPLLREERPDYCWSFPLYWGVAVLAITLTHSLTPLLDSTELIASLYSPGTDRTENVSTIIACSLVAGETRCLQSCSLATAVVLSPTYTATARQWIYKSQYIPHALTHWNCVSARKIYLCVLHGSRKKQQLLPSANSTGWSL
jgi:hypothetical protein